MKGTTKIGTLCLNGLAIFLTIIFDKYSYYVREYCICTGGNDKKPEGGYVR